MLSLAISTRKSLEEILKVYYPVISGGSKGDASPLTLADKKAHHSIKKSCSRQGFPFCRRKAIRSLWRTKQLGTFLDGGPAGWYEGVYQAE
jgi:hypothetical protein